MLITKVRTAFSFREDENEDAEEPFRFSEYSFDVNPKQEVKVGVGLQEIDCVGSYVGKYLISSCGTTNGVVSVLLLFELERIPNSKFGVQTFS